jgi:activating signal cointegrator complex subunit 3
MLDVMQIFGRAGRPQYDTSGEGIIITSHQQLPRYLSLMNHQLPIESQFIASLADHLNAEISSGTVTNLNEAVEWMSYTYLYVRMLRNPLAYGITHQQKLMDPQLAQHRRQLVITAAKTLDECRMIRFNQQSGTLDATHLGRTASHFYLLHDTIRLFNEHLRANMSDAELLALVCQSSEFEQMKIREEEHTELKGLLTDACEIEVKGGVDNPYGKVNILFQAYLSGSPIDAFALVSDQNYVTQNISRIFRGLFDIVLQKAWTGLAERILAFCKMCDLRMWDSQHPLQQFGVLHRELLYKLITKRVTLTKLYDMDHKEIGQLVGHPRMGGPIAKLVRQFPALEIEASAQPITRTVLRVTLLLSAAFEWNDRIHGSAEGWWVWIEDPENEHIYHHEYFLFEKKMVDEPQKLSFTIPIFEPLPSQYLVRAVSNRWLHADTTVELSFKHLILPEQYPPHTNLLDLMPLPVTALHNEAYQKLYPFSHFNPIQTQVDLPVENLMGTDLGRCFTQHTTLMLTCCLVPRLVQARPSPQS